MVGDDGPENLQVGQETPMGQAYSEFQEYLKAHKQLAFCRYISVREASSADRVVTSKHPSRSMARM